MTNTRTVRIRITIIVGDPPPGGVTDEVRTRSATGTVHRDAQQSSLRVWNPHTGELQRAEFTQGDAGGQATTTLRLVLPPVTSLFYVREQ
jgi:hypothetical protein